MTEKKSIKATLSGIGASSISLLGICCGGGACAATCGIACASPIASILGISTAGLSTWSVNLLPILTAISAVAFSAAYFSIYKKQDNACCDDPLVGNQEVSKNRWTKPLFWLGLFLTIGFYGIAMASNSSTGSSEIACCASTTSCKPDTQTKSCSPLDCSSKKKN